MTLLYVDVLSWITMLNIAKTASLYSFVFQSKMSSIPIKITLKNTTKMSLNSR